VGLLAARGWGGRRLTSTPGHPLLAAPALAALALAACLPRDDLSSYASSSVAQGGESAGAPDASSGSAGLQGQGGNPGEDPGLPGGGGSSGAGSDASVEDAGAPEAPDAAAEPDSGALDAGPVANACAATQGALQPGTNVCLFFASNARVSWQAAALACQSRGSVLVSIQDVARNDFLTSLISTDIWIGGNDPGTNPGANAFVWRDGTPVSLALGTWAEGEPDAVADQFCVAKTAEAAAAPSPASPWRDRPCSELKAYVCEQSF
jgi:hypothetical protein